MSDCIQLVCWVWLSGERMQIADIYINIQLSVNEMVQPIVDSLLLWVNQAIVKMILQK